MQGNDSSCGMTTAFNMSSSNTSISLAKKTKIYTFHYVILSQTHTCKNIISSYPHNPSSPAPGHLLDSHAQIFHSYLLTFSVYFIYYFTGRVPIL